MVSVFALLFDNVMASSVCPPGTIIKYLKLNDMSIDVGPVRDDGTVDGLNFSELKCYLNNVDSRQTCNRLHAVIDGESIGLSALMARALPRATHSIARVIDRKKLPPCIIKLYRAWRQGYKDIGVRDSFPRARNARYSHFYPDNHIYDADHVIARHAGGSDAITNIQAMSLPAHRTKTNREMAQLRARRSLRGAFQNRRANSRRQCARGRYWLRASQRVDYRSAGASGNS